jgi:GDP-mannose 6-dehydrogenase
LGTPGAPSGELELKPLVECVEAIGRALNGTPHRHLVVIRSTVPPGTLEQVIVPRLEASAARRVGRELGVVFNPEFMREGTAIADFHDPPLRVLAASDPESFGRAAALYSFDASGLLQLDFRTAEMLKLACNAFHAMKVAFANEVDSLCHAVGADAVAVMDALCSDRKLNLAPSYLKPGSAFGGSCLAKDIRALLHDAGEHAVRLPLFQSILESNELRFEKQLQAVLATGARRFALLGLASKGGADDLRGSPGIRLAHALHAAGAEIRLFDPCLHTDPSRNGLPDEHRAALGSLVNFLSRGLAEAIARSDVIVLTNNDTQLHAAVTKLATHKRVIDFGQLATSGLRTTEPATGLGQSPSPSLDLAAFAAERVTHSSSSESPAPVAEPTAAVARESVAPLSL